MRVYCNLENELARKEIPKNDIAKALGIKMSTADRKLKGCYPFSLDEALKIQKNFFPQCEIKYLFATEKKGKSSF